MKCVNLLLLFCVVHITMRIRIFPQPPLNIVEKLQLNLWARMESLYKTFFLVNCEVNVYKYDLELEHRLLGSTVLAILLSEPYNYCHMHIQNIIKHQMFCFLELTIRWKQSVWLVFSKWELKFRVSDKSSKKTIYVVALVCFHHSM